MLIMLDTPCSEVECKTTGYPLHLHVSPSLPLTCVTVCHQVSNELYRRCRQQAASSSWLFTLKFSDVLEKASPLILAQGILVQPKWSQYTGLFEMIVGVLTTFHTQYTWDSRICIFLFNRTPLQVFVTYLTGALYVYSLWFYKHQHDNRVRSKLFVACQRWWFQWRFWFVPSVPGYLREEQEHKTYTWRNPIERNHMGLHLKNKVTVVKTPTIISNNPAYIIQSYTTS